jgi:RNA polymerase sigma factor (sigma-70 family)
MRTEERRAGQEDVVLVERALNGNEGSRKRALEAIYQAYRRLVLKVCWNMTGDAVETEELVQETFLRAFESLSRLRDPASLRSWLCQIARRLSVDRLRSRPLELIDFDDLSSEQAGENPEPRLAARVDFRKVLGAIKGCIAGLDASLAELLKQRLSGYHPAFLVALHGGDAVALKRRNDTLRYHLENCMAKKGFSGFRLKDYIAYEAG